MVSAHRGEAFQHLEGRCLFRGVSAGKLDAQPRRGTMQAVPVAQLRDVLVDQDRPAVTQTQLLGDRADTEKLSAVTSMVVVDGVVAIPPEPQEELARLDAGRGGEARGREKRQLPRSGCGGHDGHTRFRLDGSREESKARSSTR